MHSPLPESDPAGQRSAAAAFGTYLRARRQRASIALNDLATLAGLSPADIAQIEAGNAAPPSVDALLRLVTALCLPSDEVPMLLDLARAARDETSSPVAPAAPHEEPGGGLSRRLGHGRTPGAQTPGYGREPGPQTIVRGLRTVLASSLRD